MFSVPDKYLQKLQSKLSGSALDAEQQPIVIPPTFTQESKAPHVPQMLLQIAGKQLPLQRGEHQIERERLQAMTDQHQERQEQLRVRREQNATENETAQGPQVHSQVSRVINDHCHAPKKPSPVSQTPLVSSDSGSLAPQNQHIIPPPQPQGLRNLDSDPLLTEDPKIAPSATENAATPKKPFIPVVGTRRSPVEKFGLKFADLTTDDTLDSLKELIREVDWPAMRNHPIRCAMFPDSREKSKNAEVNYLAYCLRNTLEVPGTTYTKAFLPDGTPVGLIGFTIREFKEDPDTGTLNMFPVEENKVKWRPFSFGGETSEEALENFCENRVKALNTIVQANKGEKKVMCKFAIELPITYGF